MEYLKEPLILLEGGCRIVRWRGFIFVIKSTNRILLVVKIWSVVLCAAYERLISGGYVTVWVAAVHSDLILHT